jgi:hypothetical protein
MSFVFAKFYIRTRFTRLLPYFAVRVLSLQHMNNEILEELQGWLDEKDARIRLWPLKLQALIIQHFYSILTATAPTNPQP